MEDIYESTGGLGATVMDDFSLPVPTSGPPGGRPPGPLALPTQQTTMALPAVQQSMAQPSSGGSFAPSAPLPPAQWPSAPAQETRWVESESPVGKWWYHLLFAGVGAVCGYAMAPSKDERIMWCGIGAGAGGIGGGLGLGIAGYFALREKDGD